MSGGYTASTDAMATASRKITQLAEDLPDANPDLSSTPITADGFGRVHGAHADKYTTGVKTLWDSMTGYCQTLNTFGTNIGSAGSSYGHNEDTQSGAITNAGTL
ncbi:hypothetical protein HFP15_39765 [Amycolatopsis sp. K13G38]|uniref:Excreted virulence factor EspC, type VII ESX diderm n=1 Tax=Amycolatopsis acididurans TaxID=2724524 RepID=A0ABX1JGT2_9PSEU|nr:hypothetical protein [Amycolatopsis acididurans]NKQ58997.1 hypothetical protein [Amycolatopsis acididurans]